MANRTSKRPNEVVTVVDEVEEVPTVVGITRQLQRTDTASSRRPMDSSPPLLTRVRILRKLAIQHRSSSGILSTLNITLRSSSSSPTIPCQHKTTTLTMPRSCTNHKHNRTVVNQPTLRPSRHTEPATQRRRLHRSPQPLRNSGEDTLRILRTRIATAVVGEGVGDITIGEGTKDK